MQDPKTFNIVTVKCNSELYGDIIASPDKSISHRALIIASQAIGETRISNLLPADDIFSTINVLKELGVEIRYDGSFYYVVGVGIGGLMPPTSILNFGNSATSLRLILGLLASYGYKVFAQGDKSLSIRDLSKLIFMLQNFGVKFNSTNNKLPLLMQGSSNLRMTDCIMERGSAQLKSAYIFASLGAQESGVYREKYKSRNHTENLLKYFGADINMQIIDGYYQVEANGLKPFHSKDIIICGDPSSAAYIAVAALIVPGSKVIIRNICYNPTRFKIFDILKAMGAEISILKHNDQLCEESVDIEVSYSKLYPVETKKEDYPLLVDDYLILSIAATFAEGKSRFSGLEDLKNKESDRFNAIIQNLKACGVNAYSEEDNIIVEGNENMPIGGAVINSCGDHRIAMAFTILGLRCKNRIFIKGYDAVMASYPKFFHDLSSMGVCITYFA